MSNRQVRLRIANVSKSFGNGRGSIAVVDSITLEVHESEVVSVFGPNACGKTTFLNIVAGIAPQDSGTVSVVGLGERREIGMVFQNYTSSLMPWRTCAENISLPLEAPPSLRRSERERRCREVVSELDVRLPLELYPYQMSGGQKQLTCIARAMIVRPVVLLMDEPFVSLDYQTRTDIHRTLMRMWSRSKVSTVLVSHDLDEAVFLAHRVVLLSRRPCRIVRIVEVPLPHPRTIDTLGDPAFISVRNEIADLFRQITAI